MLSENLRAVIRKLVDQESFNNNIENYRTAVKVVEYRLDEYTRLKTGAERVAWVKTIVFDVCHRGMSYKPFKKSKDAELKQFADQIKQSKQLLKALKIFIN